jgi:hypothetical protein
MKVFQSGCVKQWFEKVTLSQKKYNFGLGEARADVKNNEVSTLVASSHVLFWEVERHHCLRIVYRHLGNNLVRPPTSKKLSSENLKSTTAPW